MLCIYYKILQVRLNQRVYEIKIIRKRKTMVDDFEWQSVNDCRATVTVESSVCRSTPIPRIDATALWYMFARSRTTCSWNLCTETSICRCFWNRNSFDLFLNRIDFRCSTKCLDSGINNLLTLHLLFYPNNIDCYPIKNTSFSYSVECSTIKYLTFSFI